MCDPDGLKIEIQYHKVLGTENYHASTRITCDNQGRWAADPRFQNIDKKSGKQFATIGAESIWDELNSNVNRPKDVASEGPSKRQVGTVTLPCGVSEDEFIERLFDLDRNFPDDLEYAPWPAYPENRKWYIPDDGYNSNSYTRGLGDAAGGRVPTPNANLPGWNVPVPPKYFTPQRP